MIPTSAAAAAPPEESIFKCQAHVTLKLIGVIIQLSTIGAAPQRVHSHMNGPAIDTQEPHIGYRSVNEQETENTSFAIKYRQ